MKKHSYRKLAYKYFVQTENKKNYNSHKLLNTFVPDILLSALHEFLLNLYNSPVS